MRKITFILIMLVPSALISQDVFEVVGVKKTKAKDVTEAIKGFDEENTVKGFDKDKDKAKAANTDKMAESMFRRIDVDKNGSLSLKEFKLFYSKIRARSSGRGPSRGPRRSGAGPLDKGSLKGGPQRGPQRKDR